VRAQGNPDFHVVLDYATDKELVIPCGVANPKHEPNLTWTNPLDGSEMVWIPPGKFRVGKDKTVPEMGGFSLAKHPVTNDQFAAFLEATDYLHFPHLHLSGSVLGCCARSVARLAVPVPAVDLGQVFF
jgi:formylglycine-generating enzyme required for sulfatase activity